MRIQEQSEILLPDGSYMPRLGQGTWQMGEDDEQYHRKVEGLRHGIREGIRMLDTAEMYADGKAENITGNAIRDFAVRICMWSAKYIRKMPIVTGSTAVWNVR